MEFAIEFLRPDGWWEAGRGWDNLDNCIEDGYNQLPENCSWRVVMAGEEYEEVRPDEPDTIYHKNK